MDSNVESALDNVLVARSDAFDKIVALLQEVSLGWRAMNNDTVDELAQ